MSTAYLPSRVFSDRIRSEFPFTVDKFRLSGPDGMRTDHFGLFRSDTGECVGNACRASYVPHTVDDIGLLVDVAADCFDGDADIRCHWSAGHIVSLAPSVEYRRSIFGTSDNVFPRLLIRAGYDGKAFSASLGWYRDACRNMAMLRSVGAIVSESIKHTRQLHTRLDALRGQFERIAAAWDGTVETIKAMESRQVNLAEFLRDVYPMPESASGRQVRSHEKRIGQIFERVYRERLQTGRGQLSGSGGAWMVSAWEAYNGVQGYVQHTQRRNGRPSEFDRALLALNDSAVARAESLALAV